MSAGAVVVAGGWSAEVLPGGVWSVVVVERHPVTAVVQSGGWSAAVVK